MQALKKTLEHFADCLLKGEPPSAEFRCGAYGIEFALEAYRNNYRENLLGALQGAYPVTERLVGEEFFDSLARRFIALNRSTSGNLHRYGEGLAEFIEGFGPAAELPYLADVARLEWACHLAYFAEDSAPLDFELLAGIDAENHPRLKFRMNPATSLVSSPYPVAAIWNAHMSDDFCIDLRSGRCNALVLRDEKAVRVLEIADAEFCWISAIARGMNFSRSLDIAMNEFPGFDPRSILYELVSRCAIVEIGLE